MCYTLFKLEQTSAQRTNRKGVNNMRIYNNIISVSTIGSHTDEYKEAVLEYADRLQAQYVEINEDSTITLMCKDGCICENYLPSNEELQRAMRDRRNYDRYADTMFEQYR